MGKKIRCIIKLAIFFIFFVFCYVLFEFCFHNNDEEYFEFTYDANLVKSALESINRGLDYFSDTEESDYVFDILIGIRILMEQGWLLSTYLAKKDGMKNLIKRLNIMIWQSNDLFDKIYHTLMKTQVNTMNDIGHIIAPHSWSHWTLDPLCVNASLRYKHLNVHEEDDGPVYMEISECLKQFKNYCKFEDQCWNIMTEPGSQQYELSHQLMFLMLADQYGCNERLSHHIVKSRLVSLLNVQTILCSNMFNETIQFAQLAKEHSRYRDIFVEDVTFCGILGFHQLTNNKEWVRNIIKWQHISGCWAFTDFPEPNDENNRRKRSDNLIGSDKCSLHMTTLSLGALIVNIKNEMIQLFEPSRYNC